MLQVFTITMNDYWSLWMQCSCEREVDDGAAVREGRRERGDVVVEIEGSVVGSCC